MNEPPFVLNRNLFRYTHSIQKRTLNKLFISSLSIYLGIDLTLRLHTNAFIVVGEKSIMIG